MVQAPPSDPCEKSGYKIVIGLAQAMANSCYWLAGNFLKKLSGVHIALGVE